MGQAGGVTMARCSQVETCSSLSGSGKEQISTGPVELREKTYVTARADADTALPISVRSQLPTARWSPRCDLAPGYEIVRPGRIAEESEEPESGTTDNRSPPANSTPGVNDPLPPEGLL
mmetsp:Transcript_84195/g.149178  ORF Transcript_84195/g.149178 Transcript_84195/m.149178 type:complete len:119 (-) Transcript_84195:35-391(-)